MRTLSIAAIAVVILIIGGYVLLANFSTVPLEYVCEGETQLSAGPPATQTLRQAPVCQGFEPRAAGLSTARNTVSIVQYSPRAQRG